MNDSERFSRQERLAEIGATGQARIARFEAVIRGTEGVDVERAYLAGAGVGKVVTSLEEAPEPFVHAATFEFVAAREVGAGAWRALAELRRALEMDPRR